MARNYSNGGKSSKGRRRRGGRSQSNPISEKPAPKPTFFEKIIGFFTGKPATPPRPARRTESDRGSSRPDTKPPARPSNGFRKPELVEVTSPRIYAGNLSYDATESDLYDLFNGVGTVKNVEIVCHRDTHRSKGFAFVQMQTVDEAKRAVADLHDKEYMGRKLVVSGAKAQPEPREERTPQPEQ